MKWTWSYFRIAGLKILIICFESQLNSEWFRIARAIRDMGNRQEGNGPLWRFLEFIPMYRSSLFTFLLPFVHTRLQISSDDSDIERHYQQSTKEKLATNVLQSGRSRTVLLKDLGKEMGDLREGLNKRLQGMTRQSNK